MENISDMVQKINDKEQREMMENVKRDLQEYIEKAQQLHERYDFTWVGKAKAFAQAGMPISKNLRPQADDSVNWNTTQNLFVEGDNLDALKLLQECYLGKVKMIYIDPPYNTGKDFVYHDHFKIKSQDYDKATSYRNDDGLIQFKKNEKSNGAYHSDWLSMMYPRLKLARNLLTDDGVIFISIDDNEQANLKKLCDEIFGEDNFVTQIIWERAYAPINLMKHFSTSHDYILCYARAIDDLICNGLVRSSEANDRYSNPDNDIRGVWKSSDLSVGPAVESNIYTITTPSGRKVRPPAGRSWSVSESAFSDRLKDNRIWFGPDGNNVPSMKRFLTELRKDGVTPMTVWKYSEVGHSQEAKKKLNDLFGGKALFDYPKGVDLIKRMLMLYTQRDSIVLDFFAGTATTAHAVMQLNAEDGGNRKFILVQLDEQTPDDSEARKAGYHTIPQIARERIRRAGKKILDERKAQGSLFEGEEKILDVGFRTLKIDTDYINENVAKSPALTNQHDIFESVDNIKTDRTPLDLLFAVLVAMALELHRPIDVKTFSQNTVYCYDYFGENSGLVACFDHSITEETVKNIAALKPLAAVFRDSSFKDSKDKVNLVEYFRMMSNNTKIKVL
jgi:adenine-specific DNA-methyltransferase